MQQGKTRSEGQRGREKGRGLQAGAKEQRSKGINKRVKRRLHYNSLNINVIHPGRLRLK